jgi:SAM-dependent methyltransferase
MKTSIKGMNGVLVDLLLFLNRLFPRLAIHQSLETAKQGAHDYFNAEMSEGVRILDESAAELNLVGKRVLDMGSGLGGKTCLYAQHRARRAIGLDIRPESIFEAGRIQRSLDLKSRSRVSYVLGDAASIPLEDGAIDVVISINVFEHLAEPGVSLLECARVLGKGGCILLRFSPWYSAWGPHLNRWINLPWPHLLFSDEVLIGAANRIEACRHYNTGLIDSAILDLRGKARLPGLNRLTISQFQRLIRETRLTVVSFTLLPIGYDFLGKRGICGNAVLGLLQTFTHIPLLREIITTKILCILTKE